MAWDLEIHHIDVGRGDATLFVAREVPPLPAGVLVGRVRSALIDGGLGAQGPSVHAYITGNAALASLDVMVATHYDQDHINGLTYLLTHYAPTYDNTIIFDRGWPATLGTLFVLRFIRAINGLNNLGLAPVFGVPPARLRPTNRVLADGMLPPGIPAIGLPAVPLGAPGTIIAPPHWLVGQEILWWGPGGPGTGFAGPGPLPGAIGGPPTITCIAANQRVAQTGAPPAFIGGLALNENQKSLAFVVRHNNFRYYLGGDIESPQEDGIVGVNGIRHFLNPANNLAGRVHAMKVSHHGSGFSTSANFINQLRCFTAFISCGYNNIFGHPQAGVLANLQACPQLQNYFLTEDRDSHCFCGRINAAALIAPPIPGGGGYTAKAVTAGAWGPPTPAWPPAPPLPSPCGGVWPNDGALAPTEGDLLLYVNQAQSLGLGFGQFTVGFDHPPTPLGFTSTTLIY